MLSMANPTGPDQDFGLFYEVLRTNRLAVTNALVDQDFSQVPLDGYSALESDAYGSPACDGLTQRIIDGLKKPSDKPSKDAIASMIQQLTILESFKKQKFSRYLERADAYALWYNDMTADPVRVEQMSADLGLVATRRRNRLV